jgi:cold shock CspA family protein
MIRGRVKFFSPSKQFGFIAPDNGEPDIFFGRRSLPYNCTIDRDCVVEFETGVDRDGRPLAKIVRPVNA